MKQEPLFNPLVTGFFQTASGVVGLVVVTQLDGSQPMSSMLFGMTTGFGLVTMMEYLKKVKK